jgi:hypothetical protein
MHATPGGYGMHVAAQEGRVLLKLGRTFVASDAERAIQVLKSLAPFSELTVDFTDVHEFHDAAFPALFEAMELLTKVRVALRGLTERQSRLLHYLGLPIAEFCTRA